MPTEAPRRKTLPGRDSSSVLAMSAVSFRKRSLDDLALSKDWMVSDFRA
jgi:hypothetical protein